MEFNATFLISIVSFILFVIIMNFIFYKPIENIVEERKKFIDDNFDEAKKNNCNSDKLFAKYSEKIDEANSQSKAILDEKTQQAKIKRDELITEAQKISAQEIINNQNELKQTYNQSKEGLNSEVYNLANQMTNKLFGEKVSLSNTSENK